MTLLIACLLIHGFGMPGWMHLLAVMVWIIRTALREASS